MSSDSNSSVLARLSRRSQGGLYRREIQGGGSVYTGPAATAALRTLGARAFTMDREIFVAEDFDESNPEDQALYAHERHHQLNSGGAGAAESYHDAEEKASRAIERMVLHRSATGEDFSTILREVETGGFRTESDVSRHVQRSVAAKGGGGGGGDLDPAEAALAELLASGRTEISIIEELAEEIVNTIAQQRENASLQGASVRFM